MVIQYFMNKNVYGFSLIVKQRYKTLLDVDNICVTCTILSELQNMCICESVHTYACVHTHGHTHVFSVFV